MKIRTALFLGFLLSAATARALTLPVSEDSFTSLDRTIAKTAGKASMITVSPRHNGLVRFDVGAIAPSVRATDVSHARLIIYFCKVLKPGSVTVHRVTQDWSEHLAATQPRVPNYDPAPLATIVAPERLAKQFVVVDVTETVRGWLSDPASDFGFTLVSQQAVANVLIGAKEGPATGFPATLELETGGALGQMNVDALVSGANLANAATELNTGGSIVRRDTNGDFSARRITGTFSGDGSGLTNVIAENGVAATSLANINSTFMEFVRVGNPGNLPDPLDGDSGDPGIQRFGTVAQTFLIGKYEVTNSQYVRFLNSVAATDPNNVYHPWMGSDSRGGILQSGQPGNFTYSVKPNYGNKPVVFVWFYNAIRFCNWLHNGMPKGSQDATTTEDGAYLIIEETYPDTVITRKPGAKAFLPTENEWYKAAYYDPTKGGSGGYYQYPTRSDTTPAIATADAFGNIDAPSSNNANYSSGANWDSQTGNLTTVGSGGVGSESAYGAADMAGNVFEWNETPRPDRVRGARGGAWSSWLSQGNDLHSSSRYGGDPLAAQDNLGFRVARP